MKRPEHVNCRCVIDAGKLVSPLDSLAGDCCRSLHGMDFGAAEARIVAHMMETPVTTSKERKSGSRPVNPARTRNYCVIAPSVNDTGIGRTWLESEEAAVGHADGIIQRKFQDGKPVPRTLLVVKVVAVVEPKKVKVAKRKPGKGEQFGAVPSVAVGSYVEKAARDAAKKLTQGLMYGRRPWFEWQP